MLFVWRATIQPEKQAAIPVQGRSMLCLTLTEAGWLISTDMWQPIG